MSELFTITPTTPAPLSSALSTMRAADPRLIRLVLALAITGVVLSVLVMPAACTPLGHLLNSALDGATLIMFATLPMLYVSGRQRGG